MQVQKIDYDEVALSRVTSVFKESPIFQAVLLSLLQPLESLQDDMMYLAKNMLNIDEAKDYHLDFIGSLVGQKRLLVDFNTEPYFGFEGAYQAETLGTINNPNIGGYWNSYSYTNVATARRLNDEEYRRVIKARIIMNNTNCSVDDLVQVLNLVTGNQKSTVNRVSHRVLKVRISDPSGLGAYFLARTDRDDNIIPVALGVRIDLVN
ncbi:MAG: DUF2612 domain-containing protein [Bacteroidales bacterium]|nr:DUF2612 domain-containing protein [Candidatus Scybalousia scybalohippi]